MAKRSKCLYKPQSIKSEGLTIHIPKERLYKAIRASQTASLRSTRPYKPKIETPKTVYSRKQKHKTKPN